MSKKNLLSGRDKELQEMAEQYEAAKAENRTIYLDADDLADLADWYAVHHKYAMATEVVEYGLGIHPDNTALLVEQAYLFLDTQHKEQAKDILERIAEESSEVKVLKANLLLGEGKEEEAEAILDSINDKDDLANIVDVSYMYIDMGFPEKALTWLPASIYSKNPVESKSAQVSTRYISKWQSSAFLPYTLTMANVGLETSHASPMPFATPVTKAVLPIPMPPKNASTSPPFKVRPIFSPSATVCA